VHVLLCCSIPSWPRIGTLVVAAALPLLGQIKQDQPELCGKPGETVVLPPNVTANSFNAHSTLTIRSANSVANVEMPGVGEVPETCPIPEGTLLVFGSLDFAYDIYILNASTGAVLDTLRVYDPTVSPNQRWLAYRDFCPPQSEVSLSEEYLLYDLSRSAQQNRTGEVDRRYIDAAGKVIYPAVPNSAPFDNLGLPDNLIHHFRVDSMHWAADSGALVFADSVLNQLSVVWVRVGSDGAFTTYVHPVATAEVCAAPPSEHPDTLALAMSGAEIISGPGIPNEIHAQFRDGVGGACKPKTLVLHESDFNPAELEHHAPPPARKRPQPARPKQ